MGIYKGYLSLRSSFFFVCNIYAQEDVRDVRFVCLDFLSAFIGFTRRSTFCSSHLGGGASLPDTPLL